MDAQDNISTRVCDSIVYGNDWSNGQGNWAADNGVWQVGAPSAGPDDCFTGSQCAGTVLDGAYPQRTLSRLISASILLPTVSAPDEIHLRFQNWFSYGLNASGQVQISVWDANASTWSGWVNEGAPVANVSGGWSLKDVDLTAYAGETVRIAFYHTASISTPSFGWYLDDITVSVF
jgi:hypothetical protein